LISRKKGKKDVDRLGEGKGKPPWKKGDRRVPRPCVVKVFFKIKKRKGGGGSTMI